MLRGVREAGEGAGCPGTWVLASWAAEPHAATPQWRHCSGTVANGAETRGTIRTIDQPRPVVACLVDHGKGFHYLSTGKPLEGFEEQKGSHLYFKRILLH